MVVLGSWGLHDLKLHAIGSMHMSAPKVPQGMQSLRRRAASEKPSNGNTSQGKGVSWALKNCDGSSTKAQSLLGSGKWERLQGVEDFRRFLQIWSLSCKVSGLEPQKTAENRRKSQEAVSTPFSHLVSPINWKHPKGSRPKGTWREVTFRQNSSKILVKFW